MIPLLLYFIVLCLGVLIIWKAGDAFIDAACTIAKELGVSKAIIGLTLVSLATTAPEFLTSTMASALGEVGIAYGNAIGSIITNTALILAIAMIVIPISVERERVHEGLMLLGLGGLLLIFALNSELSRYEGVGLLLLLGLFLWFMIRREVKREGRSRPKRKSKLGREFLIFGICAAGIAIGSRMLIYSGANIAEFFGVPSIAIGLTIIAFGTSVPEFATAMISVAKKVPELSLGNILGANVLNVVLVLGASSTIRSLPVDPQSIRFSNPMMLILIALLVVFMVKGRMRRRHGVLFLALYVFYLIGLALWY
jgi:cation:H+ antiporter